MPFSTCTLLTKATEITDISRFGVSLFVLHLGYGLAGIVEQFVDMLLGEGKYGGSEIVRKAAIEKLSDKSNLKEPRPDFLVLDGIIWSKASVLQLLRDLDFTQTVSCIKLVA